MTNKPGFDLKEIYLVMVTFFPQHNTLVNIGRLFRLWPQLQMVVVDNSGYAAGSSAQSFFDELTNQYPEIRIIRNQNNLGIATALNQGADYAIQSGCNWLVTLDQDTELDTAYFSALNAAMQTMPQDRPIAMIGVNYYNLVMSRPGHAICEQGASYLAVSDVITSGSLVSLAAFKSLGGFLDKFFIDMVDTEFCLRARQQGYRIFFLQRPLMKHALGYKESISLLGFRFNFSAHVPFRRYFIVRNTIYLIRQYCRFDCGWSLSMLFVYLPKVLVKALLTGRRSESLYRMACGLRDGLLGDFSHNPNPGKDG